ncbi:APC family permease [Nonomuraea africana]|uniref:APA family basic amino acid/polyamine antiporter n=1 Tax=Nonomuraea africana TaxID=46171 RepID=A0ABR9KL04_9ACTN|nr:APC family permease [Nonomuraea africana]MBE1562697.1 APA family basic amino acid/polyamine antiporter [Nonomuraea africana]
MASGLARRLGTGDAVVVGLSAMIGAGVFAAFAPAASAAGRWLPAALALAAVVAYCNATSSARLAARYPESGGTYVYGRRRLGPFWGYLAGWGFVVGKTASCAAMALTFGAYVDPGLARPLAVGAVVALTVLNLFGVQRSTTAARVIVGLVLAVLAAVVAAGLLGDRAPGFATPPALHPVTPWDVLQGAGLLFFAFAGYARIATLGEEVRDPRRTIPLAIPIALGVTLVVYFLVALATLRVLGPARLGVSQAPLVDTVTWAGAAWLAPVVQAGAAVAALGALLALILGVSRTTFAMARERDLPGFLDAVHPSRKVPHRAELAVGVAVVALVLVADLREAIGFSSFGVLAYYAVANASALTLTADEGAPPKAVPVLGVLLCVVLAVTLPAPSVVAGLVVFTVGALVWVLRGRSRRARAR